MLKTFNLTIAATLILGGCANTVVDNVDAEYSKILNQQPKWIEQKSYQSTTLFLDTSIDKKSPFIRVKSGSTSDGGSVSENIYRLDCENQRVATYYSKITQKPVIEKIKEKYGYFEYASGTNAEDYLYNPTQPNVLNKLWRSFPIGDHLFSNQCALTETHKKPQNTEMPDWTYIEELSKLNTAPIYVKSDLLKELKTAGRGDVNIKSFSMFTYDTNSSNENVYRIDCKANTADLIEMTLRDSDFEYAPAADQSIYRSKKIITDKAEAKNKVALDKKVGGENKLAKTLCS